MVFSEDSRVKIPCILHLVRLGYGYLSLKNAIWDEETNIFPEQFSEAIARINPELGTDDVSRLLADVKLLLDNEDLGKAFYERLTERSGSRLIDFENFDNNSFHVVTELTCKNGDDEFRPDITLLINGMPLAFIEVKKPNNREGVLAERSRIITRSRNPKFRRFINITQLMVFSNNMEYEDGSPQPIEGAFYASPSYESPVFNYFREDPEVETLGLERLLAPEDDALENEVLGDNNLNVIKHSPEFLSNKSPDTPTNRICTSLFSRSRLAFLLRFALVYVHETDGVQKHVMRYPQLFATKAIEKKLSAGIKKGIIWHTQGSGKTALAYYNTRFLTDYFQRQGVIPKFYFIVDRLDLATQAQREFACRGLVVHSIDSRADFARDIKTTQVLHNHSGKPEITVVNIQKFQDDPDVVRAEDYDFNIQRVYFLDEVHRSYNPQGSFLANLSQSDRNAIKIGLTGTPLLGDDYNSRALFGDYFHKYYYNASIADGYTLRLIREEIATNYKLSLQEALATVQLKQGDVDRKLIYAHPTFVEPMLDYIVRDFEKSRSALGDSSIGGLVICDSADQAKEMFRIFTAVYAERSSSAATIAQDSGQAIFAPATTGSYAERTQLANRVKSAALILHDVGTKDERKDWVEDFKAGKIDLLFVYNMLLTGFDAKRLKKLYLGRVIRAHNLLQALTRVNRTYKDFRYGYVVDFADIRKEFDKTNKDYFDELQSELGNEIEHYSNPPFKMDFSDFRNELGSKEHQERFFAGVPNIPKQAVDKMAIYQLFLQHIIYSLKPGGKAAVVVPTGFITAQSGIDRGIRQHLVDNKMLAGVVSMPSNIFATTGTNVSILFIDASNKSDVVLIDAANLGTKVKDGKNQKTLLSEAEEDRIIATFNAKQAVEDFSVVVGYTDIAAKNYSLSAGQYFEVKIEYRDLTPAQFARKLQGFTEKLDDLFKESAGLERDIKKQLARLRHD